MAANKYLGLVAGRDTLIAGTQVSTGAPNANQLPALDATGHLDISLLPLSVGPDVVVCPASEAITAGSYVNFWSNAGVTSVRNADSTNDRRASGFVLAAVASGASATVYLSGPNTAKSGLTVGARYFLAATGAVISTAPATPTYVISQFIGIATDVSTIDSVMNDEIVL